MIADLFRFLAICAAIAGGTLLAGTVRGEFEKGARMAKVVAACLNGTGFSVPGRTVLCDPTEVSTWNR